MATPPTFTSGSVLTAAQMNAVGLWLVKSQNIGNTGIVAIDVTNAFSADFDNYRIEIVTDASGDGSFMYLTLGTVATGYFGSIYFDNYNGASTGTARRNNSTLCEIGVGGQNDNTAIAFDIQSPNLAKATNWHGTYFGGGWSGWFGGYQNSATQFTGFTLSIQAGTFSNGTIRVYGYRN